MKSLDSSDLKEYLESNYYYEIVGLIDLDWAEEQPRKTIYEFFENWQKDSFKDNERIVLFSRKSISTEMLVHVQKCASQIDISNSFILICGKHVDPITLESIRKQYSTDDLIFNTMELDFSDRYHSDNGKNSLITLPEFFCFSPWANFEITSRGEFRPCCVYKESIKDTTGRPYNIDTDSIESVYKSQYLIDLRKQFISGGKPSGCSHCWFKEKNGGKANRYWFSENLGISANKLHIEQTESLDNLVSLDIKLGNLCNFKCRICDENSSSKIAEEKLKHSGSTINLKVLNARGRWTDNENIWNMLETLGSQLQNIDFYGGEPFLIKQQEKFLDYLIDQGHSKKIRLHYNTNGSVYPNKLFEKWKKFKQVDVAFSIDNIGQRFELERGGNWKEVDGVIDDFVRSRLPNMSLSIFATVSVQNVYYLEELIQWFETKKINSLFFNILETPNFLSIETMDESLANLVVNKLKQIDKSRLLKYNIFPIIEMIENKTHTQNFIETLADYMQNLDKIRKQDFSSTHKEIADIIYKGK